MKQATLILLALCLLSMGKPPSAKIQAPIQNTLFINPRPIILESYKGDCMEPFISHDGKYLFFNDSNAAGKNTDIHWAMAHGSNDTFRYKGRLAGVNSEALDAVPSMDEARNFYFISNRSWNKDQESVYRGKFADGRVSDIHIVTGISRKAPAWIVMDAEITREGNRLFYSQARFEGKPYPVETFIEVAEKQGSGFKKTRRSDEWLEALNSGPLHFALSSSHGGKELFLTRGVFSGKDKGFTILRSLQQATGKWEKPHVLPAFSSLSRSPSLSGDGKKLYFHKKIKNTFRIWVIDRRP